MGISRRHLNSHKETVSFDIHRLADILMGRYPEIRFCFLLGSARDGVVNVGSDLDLALYLNNSPDLDFYSTIEDAIHEIVPHVRIDLGFLSSAEPVFCFEALKGKLLFARDMEEYATFFSKTCREYERQMIDYERQHRYRMEAGHAI